MHNKCNLKSEFFESINDLNEFGQQTSGGRRKSKRRAVLCWGKAATNAYQANRDADLALVISPDSIKSSQRVHFVRGDHPIPGEQSEAAAGELIHFFTHLARQRIKYLDVYLSGGASSLAWMPSKGQTLARIQSKLRKLYRAKLTIAQLNRERSHLCQLKNGGAYDLLKKISPITQSVRVYIVSDVSPFGPEVVGSGPFAHRRIHHQLIADNRVLMKIIKRKLKSNYPHSKTMLYPFLNQSVNEVARKIGSEIKKERASSRERFLIFGCEPQLKIPKNAECGGRQTHLAGLLLLRFQAQIAAGELEILCAATDGVDGKSKSMGAFLNASVASRHSTFTVQKILRKSLKSFDSASALQQFGALLPRKKTGTNVQDIILIHLKLRD